MRFGFHPRFGQDERRFAKQYAAISPRLEARFRIEVAEAIALIKAAPTSAGHFLRIGPAVITFARRRNLVSFPVFVLYKQDASVTMITALIPARSNPLGWLKRVLRSA